MRLRLDITARLTATAAALTAVVLLPAGLALHSSSADAIRLGSERAAESAARNLAFMAILRWDEDLMVEFKDGVAPCETLALDAPHWAVARADGTVIREHGIFEDPRVVLAPGESFLVENAGRTYRVASAPLFESPPEPLATLPSGARDAVRELSPHGRLLKATRKVKHGQPVVEVLMLEGSSVHEIEATDAGDVVDEDIDALGGELPGDILPLIGPDAEGAAAAIVGWRARDGQLVAVIALRGGDGVERRIAVNRLGERFRLDDSGEISGLDPDSRLWVFTVTDAGGEVRALAQLSASLAIGVPLVWGAIVLVSWYVTRRAFSPVRRIVETAERIELSRLDERLPAGDVEDELSAIATTINRMLDRIAAGYRRERRFTGDASHELRSPLAAMIADLDVTLSRRRGPDEYAETLRRCRRYARNMQRLVESLLWLSRLDARGGALDSRSFELADLVTGIVTSLAKEEAERIRLSIGSNGHAPLHARGEPDLVRVMIQNLLLNALRHSGEEGPVDVHLERRNGEARVEIRDHGDGIPEAELDAARSRFYRVDRSRSRRTGGFGLGLAIASEVARAHGAELRLENHPQGGLVASVSLPAGEMTPEPGEM